jgi:hypothetical protein
MIEHLLLQTIAESQRAMQFFYLPLKDVPHTTCGGLLSGLKRNATIASSRRPTVGIYTALAGPVSCPPKHHCCKLAEIFGMNLGLRQFFSSEIFNSYTTSGYLRD